MHTSVSPETKSVCSALSTDWEIYSHIRMEQRAGKTVTLFGLLRVLPKTTPDGVRYDDPTIDHKFVNLTIATFNS